MNTNDVVKFLNQDATDEQFAEVFALLELSMNGRRVPQIYDTEQVICNMNVDSVCNRLRNILKEIQENVEDRVLDEVLGKE